MNERSRCVWEGQQGHHKVVH